MLLVFIRLCVSDYALLNVSA
ncbi:hypothetical protein VCHENC02_0314A, partial [Vibrio harveyi]